MAGRQSKSGPSDRLRKQIKSRDDEERKQLNERSAQHRLLWDIEGVIRKACTIHRLSGAQVWIPCNKQGRKYACPLSDENQNHCHHRGPIVLEASPTLHHFIEACGEHDHLMKGEGVVGKAFATNEPWFSADISSIPKANYPLSEYARKFGMRSAVAVPLHIIGQYNLTKDYVYEFFLPFNCTDPEEQMKTLTALISTLQRDVETIRKTNNYREFQLVLNPLKGVDYNLAYIESSSFPEANLRGPPSGRRLLPEPSYQNNKCPDQTPSIEPAEVFEDAIGQGSFLSMAVNETSHGTGEKTSLKDATGKGTGEENLRGLPSGRRLLPEPSYQNNQCPDQTPSIEPAEVFEDAIGQGSFLSMAANEASHGTGEKTINVPVTSPKDATVKGTGCKSSRSVGIKRDWAWQYCSTIEGNSNGVICSFCGLEIKGGGITRFKSHIDDGDPSKNVKKCKNVPDEIKPEIEKRMKGDYNIRK